MSVIQDTLFDPEISKKRVMTPAQLRAFRAKSRPICGVDPDSDHCVSALLHPDGRIAITAEGRLPKSKSKARDTLHLMLYAVWFNAVLGGEKRVEYRQMTPRWAKQIWERRDTLKTMVLHRGYTRNVIRAAITKIDIGPCPYTGWEGDYYRIAFEVTK